MTVSSCKSVTITRAVYIFSWVVYFAFCLSLLAAELLLSYEGVTARRELFNRLAEYLLYFFPNNLYLLLYGITSNNIISLIIIGFINIFFFRYGARYLARHNSGKSIFSACTAYVIFSGMVFVLSIDLFFRFFFMNKT